MRTFISALRNKANLLVATGLGFQRSRIPYVGYVGRRNFGDELLLDIYRRVSGRAVLPVLDSAGLQPALNRSCVLGGGTIIGGAIYLESITRLGLRVQTAFCPGVVEGDVDPRWVDVLSEAAVFTRSVASAERLQSCGLDACSLVDPAIFSQFVYELPVIPEGRVGSVILALHGQHRFREAYERIIEGLTPSERQRLVLMASSPGDLHECRDLKMRFGGEVVLGWQNLPRTLQLIRDAQFVFSTRLHPGICAASFGTPFRLIPYGPKHSEFACSVGAEAMVAREHGRFEGTLDELRSADRCPLPGVARWFERFNEFRLYFSAEA